MSAKVKTRLAKYGGCAVFTALMVWLFVWLRETPATLAEQMRLLCDAFTIPAVMLLCLGGLVWASNEGALDGIGYVLSFTIKSLTPGKRGTIEKYADYVERKREKRGGGYGFLLISGAVVMAIALVFLGVFYLVYPG